MAPVADETSANPSENTRRERTRLGFVWDYDLDERQFGEILAGSRTIGRLDRDWAAVRLIEHGSYEDIVRLLGFPALVAGWPRWRGRIRSVSRRRGLDFLAEWLPRHHPNLV